jgi:hypothetical protein
MKMHQMYIPIAVAAVSLVVATLPTLAESSAQPDALKNARDATAIFTDPTAAVASGYDLLTDAADIACIDMPGQGGMGVHFVKGPLVQAGTIDAARPQALVYEVQPDARLRLVALEYVVFQSAWDASHNAPPELFGEAFMLTPAGNRFGLPAYYSLHAWIYKDNPSGTFNPWNPTVKCDTPTRADDGQDMAMSAARSTARTAPAHIASIPRVPDRWYDETFEPFVNVN